MKITILCTSPQHPVNRHIQTWMRKHERDHVIQLLRTRAELQGGDVLFLISCAEIVRAKDRALFKHTFVLHASDLPKGRGWNPHIWAVVGGATEITVTLLEAEDKVDTGAIWAQVKVPIPKHFLWNELNEALFVAEFDLMDTVIQGMGAISPREQAADIEPTYHRLRTPADSRIDPDATLRDQFDLVRVCDPDRYPAYIDMHGIRYALRLTKMGPADPKPE